MFSPGEEDTNVPMKIGIKNEKDVTPDDILAEANSIWREANVIWKKEKVTEFDTRKLDEIYYKFREEHKALFSAYPTVLRHMLQEKQYHPDAFRKYLKRIKTKPYLNDEQRRDSYADYAVLLFKSLNPRWTPAHTQVIWQDYRKRLQKEDDDFKTLYEKMRRDVEEEEARLEREKREELKELLKKMAEEMNISTDAVKDMNSTQLGNVVAVLSDIKKEDSI